MQAFFWMFAIDPFVSAQVLRSFNCVMVGSTRFLQADMRISCPYDDQRGFLFVWSLACSILYPLGIPLLMLWTLFHFHVPEIARYMLIGLG